MTADGGNDNDTGTGVPETCSVAFKEWAGICAALADGRQSLIVRKGGIAEGPRGFVPEHSSFWLYPTYVHQAEQGLRIALPAAAADPGPANRDAVVPLDALAVVDSIAFVDREETLGALDAFHVWTEETLARRFHYRKPGLWALGVRIFRRDEPYRLDVTAEHAGCKTWVPFVRPLATGGCRPVLDQAEFARRRAALRAIVGGR